MFPRAGLNAAAKINMTDVLMLCQDVVSTTVTDIVTLINLLLFRECRWHSVVEGRGDVW